MDNLDLNKIKKQVLDISRNYSNVSNKYNDLLKLQEAKNKKIKELLSEKQKLDEKNKVIRSTNTNNNNNLQTINTEKTINNAFTKLANQQKNRINSSMNSISNSNNKEKLKLKSEEAIKLKNVLLNYNSSNSFNNLGY